MSDVLAAPASVADPTARDDEDTGKRKQIIDGARTVFHASGFDAASMNEIARVAGVSKGTLYVYFDSKEALFEALIRQDKREQAEQSCRIDPSDADVRETLVNVGYRLVSRMLEPALVAQLRTIVAVSSKFPRIGRAYYEAGPQLGNERLAAYMRLQTEAGHLDIEDFDLAACHFGDLCKSRHILRSLLCFEGSPSPAQLKMHIRKAVDVFLRAYGTGR